MPSKSVTIWRQLKVLSPGHEVLVSDHLGHHGDGAELGGGEGLSDNQASAVTSTLKQADKYDFFSKQELLP